MPDQRSVMKEFRSLDEKRRAEGLTPEEEARHAALRDLMGPEMGAGGLRTGFDVNAAAARLKDSLLPAGLRNRPPPAPAEPEPATPAIEPPDSEALGPAYAGQPPEPASDAFFDPSSLGIEGGQDSGAQAWDPDQPYDPNAPQTAWDPNQPYDPNAPQTAWDPNQPYDPNAPQAAWDPNQPYDPNAPQTAWGPDQPYDPNAPQAAWDPNQPYDPNAPQAAWDRDQPNGLGATAGGEASAEPRDEGEAEPELPALGEPFDAAPETDAEADGLPPEGWNVEPSAVVAPETATGEYDADVPWSPPTDEPSFETSLPFDPATASAIGPDDMRGPGPAAEYDDTQGFGDLPAFPPEPPNDASGFEASPGVPTDVGGWQPDDTLEGRFRLESGGSFDAAAAVVAPEWAVGGSPSPWDSEQASGHEASQEVAASLKASEGADVVAEQVEMEPGPFELPAEEDSPADVGGEEWAGPSGPAEAVKGAAAVDAPDAGPWDAEPFGQQDTPASGGDGEPAIVADPSVVSSADWQEPEPARVGEGQLPEDAPAEPPLPGPHPALDFSRPDLSAEEDDFTDPGQASVLPVPAEAADASGEEGLTATDVPQLDLSADADAEPSSAQVDDGEIPTIEGEEILEEILEEIPPEEVPPPPSPSLEYRVPGVHRVVVHTVEGHVKRGVLTDADLTGAALELPAQPGAAPEIVPTDAVKAIFFMLPPGEKAPAPEGKKVRVTFRDGRQVAGFGPEYREDGPGFFMIPGDTRTNTGRIWVYRSAVRQVVVS